MGPTLEPCPRGPAAGPDSSFVEPEHFHLLPTTEVATVARHIAAKYGESLTSQSNSPRLRGGRVKETYAGHDH